METRDSEALAAFIVANTPVYPALTDQAIRAWAKANSYIVRKKMGRKGLIEVVKDETTSLVYGPASVGKVGHTSHTSDRGRLLLFRPELLGVGGNARFIRQLLQELGYEMYRVVRLPKGEAIVVLPCPKWAYPVDQAGYYGDHIESLRCFASEAIPMIEAFSAELKKLAEKAK